MDRRTLRIAVFLLPLLVLFTPLPAAANVLQQIGSFMAGVFLGIGGGIATLGLIIFNLAATYGVLKFSQHFGSIEAVNTIWTGLRDLANVFLIFMFLFIGIQTILGNSRYGYRQLLIKLLIVALLINFSLFAVRAVIDVSHVFVEGIYNGLSISPSACSSLTDVVADEDCLISYGLGGVFAEQLGIVSFGKLATEERDIQSGEDPIGMVIFGFLGFIFLSVVGVAFVAAGIMLVGRIIGLVYAMIMSPLAAAAYVLPQTRGFFDKWLNGLLKHAFVAPILFFLLGISLLFMKGVFDGGASNVAQALMNQNTGGINGIAQLMSNIISFIVMIAFLWAAIMHAEKFGTHGAKMAVGFAKKRRENLNAVRKATQGLLGRNFVAKPISGLGKSAQKAWNQSMVEMGKNPRLQLAKSVFQGLGIDRAINEGTQKMRDMEKNTFGSRFSVKTLKEDTRSRESELESLDKLQTAIRNVKQANKSGDATAQEEASIELQETMRQMSLAELEKLDAIKDNLATLSEHFTSGQFLKLLESKELDDGQKETLRQNRFAPLERLATEAEGTAPGSPQRKALGKKIKDYSTDEFPEMPEELLESNVFASELSDSHIEGLKKSGKFKGGKINRIEDKRNAEFYNAVRSANQETLGTLFNMYSKTRIAKLDYGETFGDVDMGDFLISKLTPEHLAAMLTDGNLNPDQKDNIRNKIMMRVSDVSTQGPLPRALERLDEYFRGPASSMW